MKESTLEQKLKAFVFLHGGLCLKWTSPGFTGVPDRIVALPEGKIVFVELKRPDVKDGLSARQKRVHAQLKNLGCKVVVVYSEEDFKEVIA